MRLKTMLLVIAVGVLLTAHGASAGGPQQDKINACNAEAVQKGLKGLNRKQFISACVSGGKAPAPNAREEKIAACSKDAEAKDLKGQERKAFMKTCLSGK